MTRRQKILFPVRFLASYRILQKIFLVKNLYFVFFVSEIGLAKETDITTVLSIG